MRFLLSKLRIFLFFPIPYLSQPLLNAKFYSPLPISFNKTAETAVDDQPPAAAL